MIAVRQCEIGLLGVDDATYLQSAAAWEFLGQLAQ